MTLKPNNLLVSNDGECCFAGEAYISTVWHPDLLVYFDFVSL